METVRYLAPQEKQGTRAMYEEMFPEDPASFVDYYYQWKTKENEILAMEEDGVCQVMLHLNPYTLWLNGNLRELPYIVAVATRPDCRKKGKMGRVMGRALQDLERREAPFAFLLPADPAYYRGQGFVFFPSQEEGGSAAGQEVEKDAASAEEAGKEENGQNLRAAGAEEVCQEKTGQGCGSQNPCAVDAKGIFIENNMQGWENQNFCAQDTGSSKRAFYWEKAGEEDIPALVAFSNHILQEKYHIFIRRDAKYYHRLLAETKAEQGGILLLKASGPENGTRDFQVREPGQDAVAAGSRQEPALKGILVYGTDRQENRAEIQEFLLAEDAKARPEMILQSGQESVPEKILEEGQESQPELVLQKGIQGWQELLLRSAFPGMGIEFSEFRMMLRIASLKDFVSVLKREIPCSYRVKVTDRIIPRNCGCYQIDICRDGGRMQEIPEGDAGEELEIGELAQLLLADARVSLREWV